MSDAVDASFAVSPSTAGDIAVINLRSANEQSWGRFFTAPLAPGIAERIVEEEHLANQFLGETQALDRLEALAEQIALLEPESARTSLVQARIASMCHRFADARIFLGTARIRGAPAAAVEQLSLSIDQASGMNIDALLRKRRQTAEQTKRLEDLVPLGALLGDLGEYDEADWLYREALRGYQDTSPFAVAWVCFQLGMLWGEVAGNRNLDDAAQWYQKSIDVLPAYVKARVHLAEIHLSCGRTEQAATALAPAILSRDPEAQWRQADVMTAQGRLAEAEAHMQLASSGFEELLHKHLLAYADHGAEFYSGSGANPAKAYELARVNLANRATLKAFEQAYRAAIDLASHDDAREIRDAAREKWGHVTAFRHSSFAETD